MLVAAGGGVPGWQKAVAVVLGMGSLAGALDALVWGRRGLTWLARRARTGRSWPSHALRVVPLPDDVHWRLLPDGTEVEYVVSFSVMNLIAPDMISIVRVYVQNLDGHQQLEARDPEIRPGDGQQREGGAFKGQARVTARFRVPAEREPVGRSPKGKVTVVDHFGNRYRFKATFPPCNTPGGKGYVDGRWVGG